MAGSKYTTLLTMQCMVGNSWESLADESVLTCRLSAVSGPYCGDSLPSDITLATSVVYIIFKSDSSNSSRGFSLAFSASGEPVTVPPTVILVTLSSPAAISRRPTTKTIRTPATRNPPSNTTQQRQATAAYTTQPPTSGPAPITHPSKSSWPLTKGIY